MALAVVRDMRAERPQPGLEDIADFETDALAGFVLAPRPPASLEASTLRRITGGRAHVLRHTENRPK